MFFSKIVASKSRSYRVILCDPRRFQTREFESLLFYWEERRGGGSNHHAIRPITCISNIVRSCIVAYEFFFSIELIKRIYLEQRKVSKGGKFFFFFRYELNIFVSRFDESGIEKGDASKTF